ncbi:MAG: FHA domain-containing protein, partial [Hyphomicrobiaceae bacterium]|nr:FHA domain-containing protein [Hyphomicrobiaceae bacterium]
PVVEVKAEPVVVKAPITPEPAVKRPAAPDATANLARAPMDPPRPKATADRTQLVRGRLAVPKTDFHQDPVVGWLVVVGGQGLGAFRPIFEGNNTVGRARTQRIAIDFGDEAISNEEQAYIRYDSSDRSFLFVPNLSKTNVVSINNKKPTAAVALESMDVITMGRTQLAFIPFCGNDFDWSELADRKK